VKGVKDGLESRHDPSLLAVVFRSTNHQPTKTSDRVIYLSTHEVKSMGLDRGVNYSRK
jgi:hypothetical protein